MENLRFAFQGIWSHKLRSFLTMLGVIIGIASIIAIVSTIQGTNQQIMQNLIGAGNNNVKILLRQGEGEYYMDMGAPKGVTPVTRDQIDRIRGLEKVADASFYYSRSYVDGVMAGSNRLDSGKAVGIDDHYLSTVGYEVYAGRPFIASDYSQFHKVLLLDEAAANRLFPDGGAVGSTVEIRTEPYTVVGLVRKADTFQPVINSFEDYLNYSQQENGAVMLPAACWPITFNFDEPENCVVRARETEDMSSVGRDAEAIMNESVNGASEEISYKAEDLLETARNRQELAASTNNLLIWVASIALIVGAIGVANIMLVSVTERTSEIGLKKALGARRSRILWQFLTESAVLTSLGGILGVIAGIILAETISRMSQTPVAISIPTIIGSVVLSILIGIVSGLAPALKASRLDPIEALRRE